MVNFFIDRPVFAWVLAILVMLAGALAIKQLPVSQYPSIAPPSIAISGNYPGASAETAQSTVVQVIEQQLSGIDHLLYFSSESDKDGSIAITLYFDQGTNPDIAQVQVQNKLQLAMPSLPQEVQQQGLRVAKSTRNFLMVVGFYSKDGKMTSTDISDFIASVVQDPISRTSGVGDYILFGAQYGMRIWIDPAKLHNYGLTPDDIVAAVKAQNVQVASGELGGLPATKGQQINATVIGPSRLSTPDQFGGILVKTATDGSLIRLRDVARITLEGENFSRSTQYNGMPAAGLAVKLAAGSNALETATAVRKTVAKLHPLFPPGVDVVYPYDTTPFIVLSIEEVVKTLLEAIGLVFLVMLLFLQNFRATLIPTIAVPVVLLGTFAVLSAAGFSINVLTLFGMVLAIGLLVDDAIVVVENVERVMSEEGLSPKAAVKKSMKQITGALVGIALVLTAVFIPMAFFGGSTGVIYRQFSITMAAAMLLSVMVALVFTPVLCATLLKPVEKGHEEKHTGFFGLFNRGFNWTRDTYGKTTHTVLRRSFLFLLVYVGLVATLVWLFPKVPTSFLPDEDQGYFFIQVTTPPGATSDRTQVILDQMRTYLLEEEKANIATVFTVNGFNFGGRGQNSGLGFVRLKDWKERPGDQNRVQAIVRRAMGHFMQYKDALAFAFAPPAVNELGNSTGYDLQLLDLGGVGHEAMMNARNQFLGMAAQSPLLMANRPNGLNDEPQYKINIDRERASALGLSLADINDTLSAGWGAVYVNDFVDRGRIKKVYLQGDAPSRMVPDDLGQWYVRNKAGDMVPFSAFATGNWLTGSPKLERYNGASSIELLGAPARGLSTGVAMDEVEKLVAKLPNGIGYDWTGLSFEERRAGAQTNSLYAVSLLVVFLCLAALYESWSIPFAVLLIVPIGVLGAVAATYGRGLENDIFFQVGLLTTVGLSAKNAILIIEFAKENYDREGMSLIDATMAAARQRLRPILMTSLAFILGVLPLALAHGAGSGGQNAIGTGVVGGMVAATVLAIFFIPLFFVTVLRLFRVKPARIGEDEEEAAKLPPGAPPVPKEEEL